MVNTIITRFRAAAGAMLMLLGGLSANAQTRDVSITLDQDNVPVGQVMKEIENQSRYLFINKGIDTDMTVSVDVDAQPVETALSQMFEGTDVTWSMDGAYIILTKKDEPQTPQGPVTVKGTVRDQAGFPVPGAAIMIAGTSTGVVTDIDGNYSITIDSPSSATMLQASILGYETQTLPLNGRAVVNVVLSEESTLLEGVVVTALGIEREEKALSYNVQEVSSDIVNTVKDANFVNSLSGKVAGLQISQSSSGAGGSTRVIMRGVKSISGNNNALYVVDGIPMPNLRATQVSGI